MSTTTETATVSSTVVTRARVGLLDLIWVAWRQHRIALISTTAGVLALCAWMWWNTHQLVEAAQQIPRGTPVIPLSIYHLRSLGTYQVDVVVVFAGLIAVFWAAPLLAREYEQRTHLLAWSQDVTRGRWLAGKLLTLGTIAVGLALLLGVMADHVDSTIYAAVHEQGSLFSTFNFEAYPLLQLGYAVFGFALGLLCSAVFRHLLPATTITLVVFAVVRAVVIGFRFGYLPPVRQVSPVSGMFQFNYGNGNLVISNGYLTASGQSANSLMTRCMSQSDGSFQMKDWLNCLRQQGVTQQYVDYRPASQIPTFRLIEFGIFLALAVICALFTWLRLRRTQAV